jgi:hypothetical protein
MPSASTADTNVLTRFDAQVDIPQGRGWNWNWTRQILLKIHHELETYP